MLSFDNLDREEDVAEAATCRVVFISKWVRLAGAEDPSGAHPLVVPNGHALVEITHAATKRLAMFSFQALIIFLTCQNLLQYAGGLALVKVRLYIIT